MVCGKCHTRRQVEVNMPDLKAVPFDPKKKVRVKMPVSCRCRAERRYQEEQMLQQDKDMRAMEALKRQSLMDERLRDVSFDSFRKTNDNAYNLKLCLRYANHFDEMLAKNQGLLFYGGVGTGKTFAAACIANQLLNQRIPVIMTSFVKLLESMQGFSEDDSALIARLNRAKLLIIDDLGAERSTDYALEKVYDIVDSRYRAKLPIILTTNLSMTELKESTDIRYTRIYDRIFEMCYPMQFKGQSWRKVEAARQFDAMKNFLEGNDHQASGCIPCDYGVQQEPGVHEVSRPVQGAQSEAQRFSGKG